MKHLSLLTALMLTSSMAYAGWLAYDYNPEISTYTSVPKSSCLEKLCERGCVEDASTGDAHCCPSGTNTTYLGGVHPQYPLCNCPKDQAWNDALSRCVECLSDYGSADQNACTPEKPICDMTDNTCKGCAELEPLKPYWDENTKMCVQCLDNYGSDEGLGCISEEKPLCDTTDYTCKTCAEADPIKPYWNAKLGQCVECVQDDQCPTPSDSKNDAVCFNGTCQECPKRIEIVASKVGTAGGSHAGSSVFKSGLYGHEYCSYDLHLKGFALSQSFSLTFTGDVETIRETTYGCIRCCNSRTFDGGVYHRLHPGTYFKTFWQYSDYGKHCNYLTFTMDEAYLERVPNCTDCTYRSGVDPSFTYEQCANQPDRYFKDGKCYACPAGTRSNADHTECLCEKGNYLSNGACYSCTDGTVQTSTETACYAKCPKGTRMWSKYGGYNYCFDCNYPYGTYAWFTKEECNHCPNRYFKDGKCSLCPANSKPNADNSDCLCNEGNYLSNGVCYSCTDGTVRTSTEAACYAKCPKGTRMWSKYGGYNYCFDCNYPYATYAWFTKAECDRCPNRYFKDNNCLLCPKGKKATADGTDCE